MGQRNGVMLTGANAKVIVNGLTLAFATDISYNITVKHANPKVLGMYETQEFTPLAYDVVGSFTIIRYVRDAVNTAGGGPFGAKGVGNGIGNWTKGLGAAAPVAAAAESAAAAVQEAGSSAAAAAAAAVGLPIPAAAAAAAAVGAAGAAAENVVGPGADEGNTHRSLVPRLLNTGHHFDIEIRQFVPVANPPLTPGAGLPSAAAAVGSTTAGLDVFGDVIDDVSLQNLNNSITQAVNALSGDGPIPEGQCGVVKLRNCRITSSSFTLSKRTAARQTFQFMARYADEDSFTADKSGIGQDLE